MSSAFACVHVQTMIVLAVAKLLGRDCERINLSSSATTDMLLGTYVPRYVNNKHTFEFREGALEKAITDKKW